MLPPLKTIIITLVILFISLFFIKASKRFNISSNLLVYNTKKTAPGYILYADPNSLGTAILVNKKGQKVHQWHAGHLNLPDNLKNKRWRFSKTDKNLNLYAIKKDKYLVKLNKNSNVLWISTGRYHHDLAIVNNKIYALERAPTFIQINNNKIPILGEYISIINQNGNKIKKLSLNDLIFPLITSKKLKDIERKFRNKNPKTKFPLDIFHVNSIHIVEKDYSFAKKGDFLISIRNISCIAIIDQHLTSVKWFFNEKINGQHHATITRNGNILLLDNGKRKTRSRAIEINPETKKIVWSYDKNNYDFFFGNGGGAQELSNGNILLTIQNEALIIEVTKEKEIVWLYKKPPPKELKYGVNYIYRAESIKDIDNIR